MRERLLLKPAYGFELTFKGQKLLKLPVYLSTDHKWWIDEETMKKEFGYSPYDLEGCRTSYKSIFLKDENKHYFSLADVFANEEETCNEFLFDKHNLL